VCAHCELQTKLKLKVKRTQTLSAQKSFRKVFPKETQRTAQSTTPPTTCSSREGIPSCYRSFCCITKTCILLVKNISPTTHHDNSLYLSTMNQGILSLKAPSANVLALAIEKKKKTTC